MPTLDEQIAQALAEAQRSGELGRAPSWSRPLKLDDAFARTPGELRHAFKILKDAGVVPPEVEAMQEVAALRERLEADPEGVEAETLRRRIMELRQHLALRMEHLRRTGTL